MVKLKNADKYSVYFMYMIFYNINRINILSEKKMNKELENLLNEFQQGLTKSKYDSYMPILRNSFFPYLEEERKKNIEDSVSYFFRRVVSSDDIIGGGIYYIDNTPKVTNESAIDKYLTATSEFFKAVIFPKWPTCQLSTVDNFKGYYKDILKKKITVRI